MLNLFRQFRNQDNSKMKSLLRGQK